MSRLVKFGWYFSIFLFLGVLLWVYAYLPNNVGIHADSRGAADEFLSKESLFYMLLGLFLLINVAFYALYKLIHLQYLKTLNPHDLESKRSKKQDLADWLLGFAGVLNIFLILTMAYLGIFNNQEGVTISHYAPVVYAGPVLIGIMLLLLIFIFVKKRA